MSEPERRAGKKKGLGGNSEPLSLVEVPGIEPGSEDRQRTGSTCVVDD